MIENKPRIVFLGSNLSPISLACLKSLAAVDQYELLVGIDHSHLTVWQVFKLTRQRHGWRGLASRIRKLIIVKTGMCLRSAAHFLVGRSLREVALLKGLQSFRCAKVNASETRGLFAAFEPDLVVVANFSQIIRDEIRRVPKIGIINFHPSLLPKYRGPSPIFWVIKNGETKSGATVHFIDDGINTGDIIMQEELLVLPCDTEAKLIVRTLAIGAPLLVRAVDTLITGTAQRIVQVESDATYFGFPNQRKNG